MEMNGQLYIPGVLPPGNEPHYPVTKRLGGPQTWSGRFGEAEIRGPWRESKDSSVVQAVAQSLYWLSYPSPFFVL